MADKAMKEHLNKVFGTEGDTSPLVHLSKEEASAFVDTIVDESTLGKRVRVEKMDRAKKIIGKLIGNGRFLHAGGKGVAVDDDQKGQLTPDSITLISKELIGAVDIYDMEIKHNIEGENINTKVLNIFAKKVANELEEIGYYADTAGTWTADESALAQFDGWRTKILAGGNIIDAGNAILFPDGQMLSKEMLVRLAKAMPTKYRRNNEFFAHDDFVIDWNELFDANYNRDNFINSVLGRRLNGVPNFRFDEEDETSDVLNTDPLNLIMGIQIEDASMSIEKERVPSLRKTTYHFGIEVDFAVEEVLATALLTNVKQRI